MVSGTEVESDGVAVSTTTVPESTPASVAVGSLEQAVARTIHAGNRGPGIEPSWTKKSYLATMVRGQTIYEIGWPRPAPAYKRRFFTRSWASREGDRTSQIQSGARVIGRFPLADREYSHANGVVSVKEHGADVIVRLNRNAMPLHDRRDAVIDVVPVGAHDSQRRCC